MPDFEFAATSYQNERTLALAIISCWLTGGSHGNREEIEEALKDIPAILVEMKAAWVLTEVQEEAVDYYISRSWTVKSEILEYIFGPDEEND